MAKTDRALAIDIGSTGLRIGEFEFVSGGGMIMHTFDYVEYSEHLTEQNRSLIVSSSLRKALERNKFETQRAILCVSGQAAFMRFVKLPPVSDEEARVRQIVEYEARQNVPFPIEEVIWDYQLISGEDEELEVMFVVIKNEIVESVIQAVNSTGLKTQLVDFAPAALYNISRANHVGDNECAMILNIGGRCSSLLFIEGGRFFVRTIPIAGYTITQQIGKEFGISTEEAEILKRRHGFVALGGAYEEPESEVAATISKIIRNVMTRLHGEINRSINVYRTQQKGNKPTHLYLSGGSSTMAFTNEFFQEKLRMEVNYLNPFKIVSLSDAVDVKALQEVAHMFPEVVGIALREAGECPVEVSLVPKTLEKQREIDRRKPFLVAAGLVWVLILAVFISVNFKKRTLYKETAEDRKAMVDRLTLITNTIKQANQVRSRSVESYKELESMLNQRYAWSGVYNALQSAKPIDIWLTRIEPLPGPLVGGGEKDPNAADGGEGAAPPATMIPFGGAAISSTTSAVQALDVEAVEWFDIEGYAVTLPGRKIFTEDQVKGFHDRILGAGSDEEKTEVKPADGEDAADSAPIPTAWIPKTAEGALNVVPQDVSKLPEIFQDSLRASGFFSADRAETQIIRFSIQEDVANNLTAFRIQARVRQPIRAKW